MTERKLRLPEELSSKFARLLSFIPGFSSALFFTQENDQEDIFALIDQENAQQLRVHKIAQNERGIFPITRVRYETHEGNLRARYIVPLRLDPARNEPVFVETRIHVQPGLVKSSPDSTAYVYIDKNWECTLFLPKDDTEAVLQQVMLYQYSGQIDYPLH